MMDENRQRLEWLDAMRGFTMILVVSYHVAQMAFCQSEKISASLSFLVLLRMPLFFFVSGFLAYKSRWIWNATSFLSLTWKKIKVQVLPTVVFLSIYIVLRWKMPFWDGFLKAMASPTKGGYWFTWVLLQIFMLYYVVAWIDQRLKNTNIPIWILWVLSLMGYFSLYLPKELGKWYVNDWMMYSSFFETMKFMHFFVIGNLVHRYWDKVQRLFDARCFFPIVTVVAFFSCADLFKWHILKYEWTNIPKILAMYSLMLIVVMFFRYYKDSFTKETLIGNGLQYIGVRTLDIYLLHFILMPKLKMVGPWLNVNHPNFVVDVVAAVSVALVTIGFCCLVSNVLKVSPLFKEYLFGRK